MDHTVRSQINQIIQALPESHLKPVLEYLRQVEKTNIEQLETANMVKKIFEEDKGLLKRLAQ